MNCLQVRKIASQALEAAEVSAKFDAEQVPFHPICCVNWDAYPYKPDVQFRIAHNGREILLNYQAAENDITAVCDADNGRVWEDACVEFFVSFPPFHSYTNIECNCIGKILAAGRIDKQNLLPAPFNLAGRIKRWASLGDAPVKNLSGKWEVSMVIPIEIFLLKNINTLDGIRARANFYKCGDNLKTPHFLSWQPIKCETPNFHLPQFFGEVLFEAR